MTVSMETVGMTKSRPRRTDQNARIYHMKNISINCIRNINNVELLRWQCIWQQYLTRDLNGLYDNEIHSATVYYINCLAIIQIIVQLQYFTLFRSSKPLGCIQYFCFWYSFTSGKIKIRPHACEYQEKSLC